MGINDNNRFIDYFVNHKNENCPEFVGRIDDELQAAVSFMSIEPIDFNTCENGNKFVHVKSNNRIVMTKNIPTAGATRRFKFEWYFKKKYIYPFLDDIVDTIVADKLNVIYKISNKIAQPVTLSKKFGKEFSFVKYGLETVINEKLDTVITNDLEFQDKFYHPPAWHKYLSKGIWRWPKNIKSKDIFCYTKYVPILKINNPNYVVPKVYKNKIVFSVEVNTNHIGIVGNKNYFGSVYKLFYKD